LRPTPAPTRYSALRGTTDADKAFLAAVRKQVMGEKPAGDAAAFVALGLAAANKQLSRNVKVLETLDSMEQIAPTVKQTAETVGGAMAIVRDNAAVASRGGEVMGQVIRTMERIQGSSKKIGENRCH